MKRRTLVVTAVLLMAAMTSAQISVPTGALISIPGPGGSGQYTGILYPNCPQVLPIAPSCTPPSVWDRVFVDPVNGDDILGSTTTPFKTVNAAVSYLSAAFGGGVVHCLPGVYSFTTNGEDFPINMMPHVSIQGTSAIDTVFDATNDPGGDSVWNATLQTFVTGTALISFFPGGGGCFDHTFVDSLTLMGGAEGVQIVAEEPINPQISNCIITKNDTGIHVTSIEFTPTPNDPIEYHPCRPAILFDTIVGNQIGVLNDNIYTINPIVAGFNEPAVVNTILDNSIADLEGVDLCDTARLAFKSGSVDTAGISPRIGPLPVPRVNLAAATIPFVANNLSYPSVDYRIRLTGNPVDEQGIRPFTGTSLLLPNGTVVWSTFFTGDTAWDEDCEGQGNSRQNDAQVDIGADERGHLLLWGFANQSRTVTGASPLRIEGRPGDNVVLYYNLRLGPVVDFPAVYPSLAPGTIAGTPVGGFSGLLWMDYPVDPTVQLVLPAFTWSTATLNLSLGSSSPIRLNISEAVLNSLTLANLQTIVIN